MRKAGLILIAVGLVITIITGISFFTKEKVVDIGKIEITKDKKHTATWSPLWGVGVMVVGAVLVLSGRKAA
jgi:hypothetical protein